MAKTLLDKQRFKGFCKVTLEVHTYLKAAGNRITLPSWGKEVFPIYDQGHWPVTLGQLVISNLIWVVKLVNFQHNHGEGCNQPSIASLSPAPLSERLSSDCQTGTFGYFCDLDN